MKKKQKKEKNLTLVIVVAIVLIIALISAGTFAWWSWRSTNTTVTFTVTGGSMTIDGGGSLTGRKLVPTNECSGTYAITRTVTVRAVNETATSMTASVQMNTSSVPTALKKTTFKYYISETSGCNIAGSGNFSGTSPVTLATFNVPAGQTVNKTYYFYTWLDSSETTTATQGDAFSMTWAGTLVQNAT